MSSNLPVPVVVAELVEPEADLPLVLAARGESLPAMPQADTDQGLVEIWVKRHRSDHTRRNYQAQADRFLAFVGKPLRQVRIGDVQAFAASLEEMAPATRANIIAAVKSLLTFGQEVGYLQFNVGKAVKAPPVKNTLAERIMSQGDTLRMIALEPGLRNRTMLTLLYGGGLRLSEARGLRWRDVSERDGGAGQITVYGKGGKTRVVLLSPDTWRLLAGLRASSAAPEDANAPLFPSREGGLLDQSQLHRIVKAAAARAGLSAEVSAHWLRHAHASHALDRGAPIHLVQATLGHASVSTTGRYLHARPSESSARFLGV
ncbi:tyrosine-type recombinase/integrase [Methylobacterium aquaticum]|uniref:tyrosine-type recombinase/integrase n=1 Tax=Methylobacterium aquaticum TaxID=270351 RepID=UPI003D179CA0